MFPQSLANPSFPQCAFYSWNGECWTSVCSLGGCIIVVAHSIHGLVCQKLCLLVLHQFLNQLVDIWIHNMLLYSAHVRLYCFQRSLSPSCVVPWRRSVLTSLWGLNHMMKGFWISVGVVSTFWRSLAIVLTFNSSDSTDALRDFVAGSLPAWNWTSFSV